MSDDFSAWVGKTETAVDVLDPVRSNALRAALGEAAPLAAGDELPLLHHWLYFWNVQPPHALGADGHPAKGGFLPPVSLPRRMWAGGRLKFLAPLKLGETVARISTILKVETKVGRSGTLVFVTVRHELTGGTGLALSEEQDLVYREAAAPGSIPAPAASGPEPVATWRSDVLPDPVLLFRYSALTMNGHRIHYDRPYAIGEEAYPGLVVHGPLQATLLVDLANRHAGKPITGFDFRGQAPAFDGTLLNVCGDPTEAGASLWTEQAGAKSMVATVHCAG
ncbi:MAG: 3-methylfumaryl-CoA hydratase [Novosphingobium sp.]|nr:3-methylfumaryl-CoA hydratase [Novosphingobium sp.]